MRRTTLALILITFLGIPMSGASFYGDVDPIPATLVTDKLQTGEPSDHEYEVTGVNSEGTVSGSTDEGQIELMFKDLVKIEIRNNVHFVEAKDGRKYELKFGRLKTHYTSPTFDCMVKNPSTGKVEEMMMDAGKILSISFGAGKTGGNPTQAPKPEKAQVDRKDPRCVAEAVLKAIREEDGEGLMGLCNSTNKKKIKPGDLPKVFKKMKTKVGNVEKTGDLKTGPAFMAKGAVLAFLRVDGQEVFVIVLTNENGEYGFEDINSPDLKTWDKASPVP